MNVRLLRSVQWPLTASIVFVSDQDDVVHLKAFFDVTPLVANLHFGQVLADESLKKLVGDVLNYSAAAMNVVCFSCRLVAVTSQKQKMIGCNWSFISSRYSFA